MKFAIKIHMYSVRSAGFEGSLHVVRDSLKVLNKTLNLLLSTGLGVIKLIVMLNSNEYVINHVHKC